MSFIIGTDVILSILIDGDYLPICCARTCKLTTTSEVSGKSTIGSGIWKENIALSMAWSVSSDGITSLDSNIDLPQLRAIQFSLAPVQIQFECGTSTYLGTALIQTVDDTGTSNDAATYSAQFVGTGELYIINNVVYGNPPEDFIISNVVPGLHTTDITFTWTAAVPTPDTYTIQQTINGVITLYELLTGTTTTITVSSHIVPGDFYSFVIKSVYNGLGESAYSSPAQTYP